MRIVIRASLISVLFVTTAAAQSFTPVREQKNLSPEALKRLHQLELLNALPVESWKFHAGDIAHGESVTLDDSAWPEAKSPSIAPKEAVWYRRWIEVPKTLNGYDITGERVWFQFRTDANGPIPQIIYFNGRRVALGDDLEPIILFEPAKPGDRILVAVKLLQTIDEKRFRGAYLKIEPVLSSVAGANRPNPDDIRIQCIAAANILPALTPDRKDLLPRVEAAVAAIDLAALASSNQSAFDASLVKAQTILRELQPAMATANVDLVGNAHIDAAWLWPKSETIDVVKRTFGTALQLMREYPDYTYAQSAAQYTAWMAEKYPEMNAEIRQRVKEGRWEIVGGMWVEPDLNLPDGESIVRQLLVGQREFQKDLGVIARIGWNPDSFGYNWQLPQIYKRSGLDYFVTQKMHWNDTNKLPFRLFWWQSPDGSKVLTYFPTDYVHDNVSPTRITSDFSQSAEFNPGTTEMMDLYGIGDHGGGPTRDMLDQADHWIAAAKAGDAVPTTRYSTAQHYFSDVETRINPTSPVWDYAKLAKGWVAPAAGQGTVGIPTWRDELYFEYHRGVFTTQAKHKNNMRRSEVRTLDAEKLASLAWLSGKPYPAKELTENWKLITFNQFHDLAAGSGIGVIYKDAQAEYDNVYRVDDAISSAALGVLAAQVNTVSSPIGADPTIVPVLVFNQEGWNRSETVKVKLQMPAKSTWVDLYDDKGKVIRSQYVSKNEATNEYELLVRAEDVPSFGYKTLYAGPINLTSYDGLSRAKEGSAETKTEHPLKQSDVTAASRLPSVGMEDSAMAITLTNSHLTVRINKSNGCITSLKSSNGKEFLAQRACGNQLQTYKDTPKDYDAWNIDPGTLDGTMTPIEQLDNIALVEKGPLRATVRITRHWGSSKFTQDISLDANADEILVTNDFDWHEQHILLKAAFPLAATSAKATFEIPYGSIERPTTRDNSFEKAKFEVPAMRWADLGDAMQGVSILNDSKYGYDAVGNLLRITLLRSPTWPDPIADQGPQHFTYAIYPHAGLWKTAQTVRRGYELNDPMVGQQVFAHTGSLPASHSFASVENPNVTLTAVKKAEDASALIFRMYEWGGEASTVKLHIPPGATYATTTNLMEKPEGDHLSLTDSVVTVPIKPYEILTVEVNYSAEPPKL
jgi:alpha-mannosidase